MKWRGTFPELWRVIGVALSVWSVVTGCSGAEVQSHGVLFEQWVRDSFFGGYTPDSYTQKWDIPAEVNQAHGGIPANPKAIKYGSPVDMGDALRQFAVDEEFLLIVGFWQQEEEEKKFVKIVTPRVTPEVYRRLWEPVTLGDLQALDAVVKDRSLTPKEAAIQAKAMKSRPPFTQAIMQVNPKIDAKGQRRLQCSIRFNEFFTHLCPGIDPAPEEKPSLFGEPFPHTLLSPQRSFSKSADN